MFIQSCIPLNVHSISSKFYSIVKSWKKIQFKRKKPQKKLYPRIIPEEKALQEKKGSCRTRLKWNSRGNIQVCTNLWRTCWWINTYYRSNLYNGGAAHPGLQLRTRERPVVRILPGVGHWSRPNVTNGMEYVEFYCQNKTVKKQNWLIFCTCKYIFCFGFVITAKLLETCMHQLFPPWWRL